MSAFRTQSLCSFLRSRAILIPLSACLVAVSADTTHAADCWIKIIVGPPFNLHILVVPSGCTYNVNGLESYSHVDVRAGGTLNLLGGSLLEVSHELRVADGGTFRFYADDGETRPILRTTLALNIFGHIQIVDPEDGDGGAGAEIARTSTTILKFNPGSLVDTEGGNLLISADFENDGVIEAGDGWDVSITGQISPNSSGQFMAAAANSDMTFNHTTAVVITGNADFEVTAGSMAFNQSVETNGGFKQTGGAITVAAGKTFKATGAYP